MKKDVQSWPFKVVDREGNPYIEVEYLGETKQFSPQEISSMVLTKVRKYRTLMRERASDIAWLCIDEGDCRSQAWAGC